MQEDGELTHQIRTGYVSDQERNRSVDRERHSAAQILEAYRDLLGYRRLAAVLEKILHIFGPDAERRNIRMDLQTE
jgi:hypothetical protein